MNEKDRQAPPASTISPRLSTQPGTCPACGYPLTSLLSENGVTCPECGRRFAREELERVWKGNVPGAEPRSLPPHEPRLSGRQIIVIMVVLLLAFVSVSLGSCWWAQRVKQQRAIMISDTPALTEPMR